MTSLRRRMLDPAPDLEFRIQLKIGEEVREWGLSALLAESLGTSFPRPGMLPAQAGRALLAEHRTWGRDTALWIAYRGLLDRWGLPLDVFIARFTGAELARFRKEFAALYGRVMSSGQAVSALGSPIGVVRVAGPSESVPLPVVRNRRGEAIVI